MSIKAPRHVRSVGIMVCESAGNPPISEPVFCRELCIHATEFGLVTFAFSPLWIDWEASTTVGYTYSKKSRNWERNIFQLPEVVYDRRFYSDSLSRPDDRQAVARLKQMKPIRFLGHQLRGKWNVHQALMQNSQLTAYLPQTAKYTGAKILSQLLVRHDSIFLKPEFGTHGKGTLHIQRIENNGYSAKGRDAHNAIVEMNFNRHADLLSWVDHFTGRLRYVVQPYLSLVTQSGDPFDIRSLMQKNESGRWQLTGIAVRCGKPGSLTANLHGGGKASEAQPFLAEQFGAQRADRLIEQIRELSLHIPLLLEARYGRLCELGIDFGIDQDRNIWLLEVNSKPGRHVFFHFANQSIYTSSILNPLRYAHFLTTVYPSRFPAENNRRLAR